MNDDDTLNDPASPILNGVGLAKLMHISPASIASLRSRDPGKLPPPFMRRPLRWRREAVIDWMQRREREEETRAKNLLGAFTHPARMPRGASL